MIGMCVCVCDGLDGKSRKLGRYQRMGVDATGARPGGF